MNSAFQIHPFLGFLLLMDLQRPFQREHTLSIPMCKLLHSLYFRKRKTLNFMAQENMSHTTKRTSIEKRRLVRKLERLKLHPSSITPALFCCLEMQKKKGESSIWRLLFRNHRNKNHHSTMPNTSHHETKDSLFSFPLLSFLEHQQRDYKLIYSLYTVVEISSTCDRSTMGPTCCSFHYRSFSRKRKRLRRFLKNTTEENAD